MYSGLSLRLHYLSLLLIPLILSLTFIFGDHGQFIYVPFSFTACALILFVNFPDIVVILHSRPIYYDDLVIRNYNEDDEIPAIYDSDFCKKYQKIFRWLATISSSLMVGLTAEMWFYRDRLFVGDKNVMNSLAALGIIAGIVRIYYSITMAMGRGIMFILKLLKRREQEKIIKINEHRALIELNNIGITIGEPATNDVDWQRQGQKLPLPLPTPTRNIGFKDRAMIDLFNS
jgi:hypothetical protein